MNTVLSAFSFLALSVGLAAQAENPPVTPGKIGFSVGGQQGAAGVFCSGFQCKALPLGVTRGETITLSIRTQLQSPWILLAGTQALPVCQAIPGILNQWAGPSILVGVGRVQSPDRIRCWGGLQTLTVPVPAAIPLNTRAAIQVVADVVASHTSSAKAPAFSAPVELTVTK